MPCFYYRYLPLPHVSKGWSVVCDCGISGSYSLTILSTETSLYPHGFDYSWESVVCALKQLLLLKKHSDVVFILLITVNCWHFNINKMLKRLGL